MILFPPIVSAPWVCTSQALWLSGMSGGIVTRLEAPIPRLFCQSQCGVRDPRAFMSPDKMRESVINLLQV